MGQGSRLERFLGSKCFYIDKKFRRKGVMKSLIGGALKYAEKNHAGIVEAYYGPDGFAVNRFHNP